MGRGTLKERGYFSDYPLEVVAILARGYFIGRVILEKVENFKAQSHLIPLIFVLP